jgi:hypothetical protein
MQARNEAICPQGTYPVSRLFVFRVLRVFLK